MKRKILKVTEGILAIAVILVTINFIPAWNLETKEMKVLSGNWVNVYFETEEKAAVDVFKLADSEGESIAAKLGFTKKQDINIYIYDAQSTMQTKKYGSIGPMLGLDWYIGDNIRTDVILTSPANPGKVHNYDNNKYAVLHEMVHAYVSIFNPKIALWLTEGTALYLSNGETFYKSHLDYMEIPSYSDIQTSNPIKFSNIGGYSYAHTYIEYLVTTYGWDKVVQLLKYENYNEVFKKSDKEIYKEWVSYLQNYYQ